MLCINKWIRLWKSSKKSLKSMKIALVKILKRVTLKWPLAKWRVLGTHASFSNRVQSPPARLDWTGSIQPHRFFSTTWWARQALITVHRLNENIRKFVSRFVQFTRGTTELSSVSPEKTKAELWYSELRSVSRPAQLVATSLALIRRR